MIDRIKEHIQKKHKSSDSTINNYAPSFRKIRNVKENVDKNDGDPVDSNCAYQCIYCDTTLSRKQHIVDHIKIIHKFSTPSLQEAAGEVVLPGHSVNTPKSGLSSSFKKIVFKPPLKLSCKDPDGSIQPRISKNSAEKRKRSPLKQSTAAEKSKRSPLKQSTVVSKKVYNCKVKNSRKVNYYKDLNNFLVSGVVKRSSDINGLEKNADEPLDTIQQNKENTLPPEQSSSFEQTPTDADSSCVPRTKVELKRGKRPKSFSIGTGKKGRFHCGVINCVPCSVTANCGTCTPCLNRKIMK